MMKFKVGSLLQYDSPYVTNTYYLSLAKEERYQIINIKQHTEYYWKQSIVEKYFDLITDIFVEEKE